VSPFECVLPMVSILVGLAIGDLSLGLHRLLRARSRVDRDWLPLAAALLFSSPSCGSAGTIRWWCCSSSPSSAGNGH